MEVQLLMNDELGEIDLGDILVTSCLRQGF